MTFRVRTSNNDNSHVSQASIVLADKGYTELRVSESDEKGVYAEAGIILSPDLWNEVVAEAAKASEHAAVFSDLNYHNQAEVMELIEAKRAEEHKAELIALRGHIGRTKGWTLLGYKDEPNVAELIEQGFVKSEAWAVNADRTVYKLTESGQALHDKWVEDNTPAPVAPVKTYVTGTSATSTTKPVTAIDKAKADVAKTEPARAYTSPYKAPAVGSETKVGDKIPPYVKPAQPAISGAKS